MNTFFVETKDKMLLEFVLYQEEAPETVQAFLGSLPFTRNWIHASVSGLEIWISDAPRLEIPQENASVFVSPGEVVIGPIIPSRNHVAGCMGIYYGEGKGLDAGNIFAKVVPQDFEKLRKLGKAIWHNGAQRLRFFNE
ncbi:MAG: DUF3830 family protein [Saprospiraceae bacterium]|nr:DUF3830 family protein [Saprospiraceae bacterium]